MTTRDLVLLRQRIAASKFTIYDATLPERPDLWLAADQVEYLLCDFLVGRSVAGLPVRTRSKVVKQWVCIALGYPIPATFARTQPRFPGQLLDVFVQKSNNLQIWNEDVDLSRRYAIIGVAADDSICAVRVVGGEEIAALDHTGSLTTKYQARWSRGPAVDLVSRLDTAPLLPFVVRQVRLADRLPSDPPEAGNLLDIVTLCSRLQTLVGQVIDVHADPTRQGGQALERAVLRALGFAQGRAVGGYGLIAT